MGRRHQLRRARLEVARAFVVHNALYWLEEFHLDGLRLDAVHAMPDKSDRHVLEELSRAVADGPGRDRLVHLVLENDANEAHYLARTGPDKRPLYQAQWNDDFHHALHVMLTGETGGYYEDYQPPQRELARCLTEGFAFQGRFSPYRGRARGEPSAGLPPTSFVDFLQNHDQVGNRAMGERIAALAAPEAVRAATAVLLLAPQLPLLFMGQEWAAPEPFLFFSDLGPDQGPLVSAGRRREFARFAEFAHPEAQARIPDPQAEETRARSVLDWRRLREAAHAELARFPSPAPRDPGARGGPAPGRRSHARHGFDPDRRDGARCQWVFADHRVLRLIANLGPRAVPHPIRRVDEGRRIYVLGPADGRAASAVERALVPVRSDAVSIEPFVFCGCVDLRELLPYEARDVRELLEQLARVPTESLFCHTAAAVLHRSVLPDRIPERFRAAGRATRCATGIWPSASPPSIPSKRARSSTCAKRLMATISDHLQHFPPPPAGASRPSRSASSRPTSFPSRPVTRRRRSRSSANALAEVDVSALFFHLIEARYRLSRGNRGDFAEWVASALERPDVAERLAGIDPYSGSLERIRDRHLTVLTARPGARRGDDVDGVPGEAGRLPEGRSPRRRRSSAPARRAPSWPPARPRERLAIPGPTIEVLNRLVPILNDLGIDASWEVTIGTGDFEGITRTSAGRSRAPSRS